MKIHWWQLETTRDTVLFDWHLGDEYLEYFKTGIETVYSVKPTILFKRNPCLNDSFVGLETAPTHLEISPSSDSTIEFIIIHQPSNGYGKVGDDV